MAKDTTNDFVTKGERGVRGYNIFFNPEDFPGQYVVRGWTARANEVEPDKDVELAASLEEAREKVPTGLVWLARHPSDPRSLVEVWV